MISVLVLCENSGVVRDTFIRAGCYAMSCDLLPTSSPMGGDWRQFDTPSGPMALPTHHIGDAINLLHDIVDETDWDLLVAHPDCTYLTGAAAWAFGDGPYHQKVKPGTLVGPERRAARDKALDFVRQIMASPCPRKCIENPVGSIGTHIRKADQYIQPHEYGHDASKKTGLWLEGLPTLKPTNRVGGRLVEWPRDSGKMVERWGNQTDSGQNRLTPSDDRWKSRSKTYQGWADAMAEQWIPVIRGEA